MIADMSSRGMLEDLSSAHVLYLVIDQETYNPVNSHGKRIALKVHCHSAPINCSLNLQRINVGQYNSPSDYDY